jgi:putative Holliday junction resolvase
LSREHGVETVLVGLPLLPDGNEGSQAVKARRFGEKLKELTGLPVALWDERFSTAQAERHLIESGVRREKRKEVRDSLAAALILQSALDARSRK